MEKQNINIYVEIQGGVLQAVYTDKSADKKYNIIVNKMDYDDLAAQASDPDDDDYKESKKEFDKFERDVVKGKLVSVWL